MSNPSFGNFLHRSAGVLLHPTALPGHGGIGTLGDSLLHFLDWIEKAGLSYWQICPLVPTGYGDSPYQGLAAFAGNSNLIDFDDLIAKGLLKNQDIEQLQNLPSDKVDFGTLIPLKKEILDISWKRFKSDFSHSPMADEFNQFRKTESHWIEDYTLFRVLKDIHNGMEWSLWEPEWKERHPRSLEKLRKKESDSLSRYAFVQYLFHRQWMAVKKYAATRNIQIIGDLPIFVSYDSADCWAHPEIFLLDSDKRPLSVAGVPPDYFSETGQLWGNPLYNWKELQKTGFQWWKDVLKTRLSQCDILRVDHFRGFSACWSVPYGETTAVNGEWRPVPGDELFSQVRNTLGELPIIAEDLGVITEDVVALMNKNRFPGMKVLHFAFDYTTENSYLPHNYNPNCVVYTGTHDNDTTTGWYADLSPETREFVNAYLNLSSVATASEATYAMIRLALSSVANLAIIPIQDILGAGSNSRFNTPGTTGGNWQWRVPKGSFTEEKAADLYRIINLYGRATKKS